MPTERVERLSSHHPFRNLRPKSEDHRWCKPLYKPDTSRLGVVASTAIIMALNQWLVSIVIHGMTTWLSGRLFFIVELVVIIIRLEATRAQL